MNQSQRIVLVIALGLVLVAAAWTANVLMLDPIGSGGWFSFEPGADLSQTDDYFVVADDGFLLRQAAIWVTALAMWAGASVWLLRTRPTPEL